MYLERFTIRANHLMLLVIYMIVDETELEKYNMKKKCPLHT
jgi:hypothetical protein